MTQNYIFYVYNKSDTKLTFNDIKDKYFLASVYGNEASGEGWKYRGRGLIQITGKTNYDTCGKFCGMDLIHYPDSILEHADINIKTACWYWTNRNLNQYADNDDIVTITKKINGGLNGLQDRTSILQKAKATLNC